uniref:VWFA domain-containing protein n=1 Tax=Biomphalaria glabrata TaxID=6526 RepID=A0A2C9KDT5_BIOGL
MGRNSAILFTVLAILHSLGTQGRTQSSATHGDLSIPMYSCRAEADVVFVIDSSTSISPDNFRKMLTVAATITSSLRIGRDGIRVAMVMFSDEGKTVFNLNSYYDPTLIRLAMISSKYLGGNTYLDRGLTAAYNLLSPIGGGRLKAIKTVLVMTDGRYSNPERTYQVAELLYKNNVKVIGVGIGPDASDEELMKLTRDCNLIFKATSFDAAHSSLSSLMLKTCEVIKGIQVPEEP